MEIYDKDLGKVCVTAEGKHSESKSYERLSIVYNPIRRKSYLSRMDVPAGIHIDNTKYWQCIGSGKVNDDCIINLSYTMDDGKLIIYTLQEAIATVNEDDRRVGTLITFLEKSEDITKQPGWALYQYNAVTIDGWDNVNNWFPIYHNRLKFTGWFDSEDELKTALPVPYPGDYAYVGTNYDNSTIYKCKEYGIWFDTGVHVKDFVEVVISGDISINEEGNWVINGVDTGISSFGIVDVRGEAYELEYGKKPTANITLEDVKNQVGKRLVIKLGIPAGKPANIARATANVEMLPAGSTPSCSVTVSGPNDAKVFHFDFKLPYGGEAPVQYVTFKINATPNNSTITINGNNTNTIDVPVGSTVNWSVSASGYITKSGSQTVAKDTTINVYLEKEEGPEPQDPTYDNLRIVVDNEYVPSVYYTIKVNTVPSYATVIIDGKQRREGLFKEGSNIRISVSCPGYTRKIFYHDVTKDEEIEVILEKTPNYIFTLYVDSPEDCIVMVDNEVQDNINSENPYIGEYEDGDYVRWSVSKEGYISQSDRFYIHDDVELHINLEKEPEPTAEIIGRCVEGEAQIEGMGYVEFNNENPTGPYDSISLTASQTALLYGKAGQGYEFVAWQDAANPSLVYPTNPLTVNPLDSNGDLVDKEYILLVREITEPTYDNLRIVEDK